MDNIRLRIKDILRNKGVSSKDLAEKLGKAPQYVSNIINGGKGASLATLSEIANALNVEMADLFARAIEEKKDAVTIKCPHCQKEFEVEVKVREK